MELEANLADFQREMQAGAPSREKRSPADWIPRPPEKYALTGHRAPVTKVVGRAALFRDGVTFWGRASLSYSAWCAMWAEDGHCGGSCPVRSVVMRAG